MLMLMRRAGEEILIGDDIIVRVHAIKGSQTIIGIDAPAEVSIVRTELLAGDNNDAK